jgi:Protein involved in initiation of plasmid replication
MSNGPEDSGQNSSNDGTVSPKSSPSSFSSEGPSPKRESFDEEDIVVKANQLIRGRINWTKLEHRVVAMLVAQLKKEDESFEMQRVHISDLMDMAQVSSRDIYDRAEEVCRKLLNQKVHVRTSTDDGRRVYQGYNCLSTCRYVEGSGYIEAKFNDDMKPFLLQLKRQFTMYRLQNFMRLSSQHSMRMYELIKMREGLRHLRLSVEELREVLCCEHTYDRFSDFKRYVLERARTEIADTCDIYFTYKVEREGRTPVRVRLLIHQPDAPCTDPVLIWREGPGSTGEGDRADASASPQPATGKDAGSESATGESATGENGDAAGSGAVGGDGAAVAEAPSSSSTFDLYSTVLSGLTQEELSQMSRETVQSAIGAAREAENVPRPESAAAADAWAVARSALAELRGEDPKGGPPGEDRSSEARSPETEFSGPEYDPPEKIV